MNNAVAIERSDAIAVLTLNRPDTRNALSGDVIEELCDFLGKANQDSSLGCIVLTGAGKDFSSGGNVKEMRDGGNPMFDGTPFQMQEGYRNQIQRLPRLFATLDVPVIAAINGNAIGAGLDLATMCDIRVAAETARFAESFLRVGLISGDGGAWYLPRAIGYAKAIELALTCRALDADEAREWGLVTHVTKPASLVSKAMELAGNITEFAPMSVRLNKRLLRQSPTIPLDAALDMAASFQAIIQHTEDQKEAVTALLEKRSAEYAGR